MAKTLTMLNTIRGSLIEGFYPRGWDLRRIDRCCGMGVKKLMKPGRHWDADFKPVAVKSVGEMDERMGDAIADEIESTRKAGEAGDHFAGRADGDVQDGCGPAQGERDEGGSRSYF